MNRQTWNARQYQDKASFVAELGTPVLELLNPQPYESILDLGCGDGTLTEKIARVASQVIGIDSSPSMVRAARNKGLHAELMSGTAITYQNAFDAVFSNAALHWINDATAVIQGVFSALRPQGRFVGEFGGHGNIATLVQAMSTVVSQHREMGKFTNPWFFPRADEYQKLLENHGFRVDYCELIPRPTPLRSGVREWLKIFANHVTADLPAGVAELFLEQTEQLVKPVLYSQQDGWHADYVRLRFAALKE